jgi:outer membrane protein assembly factor BamD (BamD/ComL family)
MKTNVKKLLKKYLTNKQLFKHFGLLCFVPLFFSSCGGSRYISEEKWKDKHIVYFKTNQENVTVKNRKGEKLEQASDGKILAVYIDKLRPKNLKLTLSHPNRADTTVKIKRSVRAGALFFDCTFGAILCGIPLLVDFANVNIYQVKKSSRNLTVNMLYNNQYYEQKLYEAKQKGNIAAFEEFIKNYPESKLVIKAQNSVYYLAWNDANTKNTIPAYDDFITKYPKATQVTDAQDKVYTIAYNEAVYANTPEAFENYINKYPKSPKVDEAKIKQKTVKEIDNAYNTSLKTNTYADFSGFLNTYKNTKYNKEIAGKMASAFYLENRNKLKTLDGVNSTVTIIKAIEFDYSIRCEELNKLNITRDELLAEKLKTATNKNQFLAILKEQMKVETGDAKEDNAYAIAYRVFSNSKINLNGQYSRWRSDGTKELAAYQNNKLNGGYTKYAAEEKTILEKGNYANGNKNGTWTINFDNGKKHYVQNWDNGNLLDETEFDEIGKNLTEEKYRNYIKEGDDFMNSNDYSLAIDKYRQALNLKKNDLIQAKYNSANEKYNQWKKENEFWLCSECGKKSFKHEDGNYYANYHIGKIGGVGSCYTSSKSSTRPYSIIEGWGPFCSVDCCEKGYKKSTKK